MIQKYFLWENAVKTTFKDDTVEKSDIKNIQAPEIVNRPNGVCKKLIN